MGTLYVVGTPIGNLEDITLRALRVLREVALIAAEDTRTTRKLLAHHDIATPLVSYFEYSGPERTTMLLEALEGSDVALVSEAGTPGVSDPGCELVQAASAAGFAVVPVPGPSAVTSALAASGLSSDRFRFVGFLPRRPSERRDLLRTLADEPYTMVAFEAPHRLHGTLRDLSEYLPERSLVVCRELTKLHEEIWRGGTDTAVHYFAGERARGEYTLVLEGISLQQTAPDWDEGRLRSAMGILLESGVSPTAAAKALAQLTDWTKSSIYEIGLEISDRRRKPSG